MEKIEIVTNPNEFKKEIAQEVKTHLDEFLKNFKPKLPNEYLTRAEVAKMLSCDISTVHNYSKRKILNPLGISGRVYYLRSEVEASLIPLNG